MTQDKFSLRTQSGRLTPYGFTCGYIERVKRRAGEATIERQHGAYIITRHPAHPAGHAIRSCRTLREARIIAASLASERGPRGEEQTEYLADKHPNARFYRSVPPRWIGVDRNGYGRKIATSMVARFNKRTHRVYVCQYSNSGTAYVVEKGRWLVLDHRTPSFTGDLPDYTPERARADEMIDNLPSA